MTDIAMKDKRRICNSVCCKKKVRQQRTTVLVAKTPYVIGISINAKNKDFFA